MLTAQIRDRLPHQTIVQNPVLSLICLQKIVVEIMHTRLIVMSLMRIMIVWCNFSSAAGSTGQSDSRARRYCTYLPRTNSEHQLHPYKLWGRCSVQSNSSQLSHGTSEAATGICWWVKTTVHTSPTAQGLTARHTEKRGGSKLQRTIRELVHVCIQLGQRTCSHISFTYTCIQDLWQSYVHIYMVRVMNRDTYVHIWKTRILFIQCIKESTYRRIMVYKRYCDYPELVFCYCLLCSLLSPGINFVDAAEWIEWSNEWQWRQWVQNIVWAVVFKGVKCRAIQDFAYLKIFTGSIFRGVKLRGCGTYTYQRVVCACEPSMILIFVFCSRPRKSEIKNTTKFSTHTVVYAIILRWGTHQSQMTASTPALACILTTTLSLLVSPQLNNTMPLSFSTLIKSGSSTNT